MTHHDLEPETTPEGVPIPTFTPWRAKRERVGGWSAAVQRAFMAELTRIGSARAAAQAVGKTVRSAYILRNKPGAESFAAAWAEALARGRENARDVAIGRALHGEVVPKFRNGRFMGYRMRHNDRLLLGVLNTRGREGPFSDMRHRLEQWEFSLRREEMDRADGTGEAREMSAAAWDAHVIWQQEMKAEARRQRRAEIRAAVRKGVAKPASHSPRVRVL
ncbi:MAG: hypothetical protein ABI898_02310 [Sphingomonadales bacterium]